MTPLSAQHLPWLGLTALFVAGCIWMRGIRLDSRWHGVLRASVFVIVLLNEAAWFAYRHAVAGVALVNNLPLHLCDISVFVVLFTLATGRKQLVEFSYYAGVVGALMAISVPAISESGSIRTVAEIRYFVTHIALVGVGFYFTYGRRYYPGKGAVLRSYVAVHLYALLITPLNLFLGTNYFYTVSAPKAALLQPYPHWLILAVGSAIFLLSFTVMHLPFLWLRRRQVS